MSVRATLAAAAVLSLCVLVVREDRLRDQGLLGSVFAPTEAYAPVDYHPANLPPLKAKPAELEVAKAAPAPAVALPQLAAVEGFAAAPELASAGPDELVALASPAPTGGSPSPRAPSGEALALVRMNVLDAGERERRVSLEPQAPTAPASADNGKPCADGCAAPSVFGKPYHAAINAAQPNLDLRWKKLPCSKPGAYRYEVANRGRHGYTGVILYDGDQRWDVGELAPGRAVVIASARPLGPNPGVDHDPVFVSAWDP